METNKTIYDLAETFTQGFLEVMSAVLPKTERTYGFEFEFLPHRIMDVNDLTAVEDLLAQYGQRMDKSGVRFENGTLVDFEPGGQIEYCSPPLLAHEESAIDDLLDFMVEMNARVKEQLGIEYLAVPYFPGRKDAPLCLTSQRYVNLHQRLAKSGTRGHEMMKATAGIHLHVAICNMPELLPLFYRLCKLSRDETFGMSAVRRDIWSHTDDTRCGSPPCCAEPMDDPAVLIDRLVRFGLQAVVLGEEVPFFRCSDQSFEAFLDHLTTIFTDVRFNLKGTTLELRTPDSMAVGSFKPLWQGFIEMTENIV